MRETNFIQQNKKKWNEFEQMLETKENNPDKLSDLFVQITDDLSYSRTFYPNRSVRFYLNNIAQQVFYKIYKRRSGNLKNFRNFWVNQLPEIVYESRKELLLSLFIFIISMSIGVLSCVHDPEFASQILGDSYIEMTKENINSGDPMAVYKKAGQVDMFLGISINNLLVSFRTFIMGVFLAIGTIAIMLYNGIMVGTFQYFFYEKGLFVESFLTIWLHGTIEISCIIIAGGAGLKLGSGLIFPGTYSRMQAFQMSAKKGLGLMVGITPLIVLAALIESFVTRYTNVDDLIKLSLILASLLFIVGYFVILPVIKARRGIKHVNYEKLPAEMNTKIDFDNIQTSGETFKNIFTIYKKYFSKVFAATMIGAILYTSIVTFILEKSLSNPIDYREWFFIAYLFDYSAIDHIIFINLIVMSISLFAFTYLLIKESNPATEKKSFLKFLFQNFYKSLVIAAAMQLAFYPDHWFWIMLIIITVFPILFLWHFISFKEDVNIFSALGRAFGYLSGTMSVLYGFFIMLTVISLIYIFLIDSKFTLEIYEYILWNINLTEFEERYFFIAFITAICFTAYNMILPVFIIGTGLMYFSIKEINQANTLKEKISKFGLKNKNAVKNFA